MKIIGYSKTKTPELDIDGLLLKAILNYPLKDSREAIALGIARATAHILDDVKSGKNPTAKVWLSTLDGAVVAKDIIATTVGAQRQMWQWITENLNHYRAIVVATTGKMVPDYDASKVQPDADPRAFPGTISAALTVWTTGLRVLLTAPFDTEARTLGTFHAVELGLEETLAKIAQEAPDIEPEPGEVNIRCAPVDPDKWKCPCCGARMEEIADCQPELTPETYDYNKVEEDTRPCAFMCSECGSFLKREKGMLLPLSPEGFANMSEHAQTILNGLHKGWEESQKNRTVRN